MSNPFAISMRCRSYNLVQPKTSMGIKEMNQMAQQDQSERDVVTLIKKLKNEEPEKDHNE